MDLVHGVRTSIVGKSSRASDRRSGGILLEQRLANAILEEESSGFRGSRWISGLDKIPAEKI